MLLGLILAAGGVGEAAPLHPQAGVGDWIWADETRDRQTVRFVRGFTIPEQAEVRSAILRMTADNSYEVFLDGQLIGRGGDWRVLIEYDLKLLLAPGEHVLAVSAVNDFDVAGLVLGLRIELADGRLVEIASDDTWRLVPDGVEPWKEVWKPGQWEAATVLYPIASGYPLQIYRAPLSLPLEVRFWQRTWFQVLVAGTAVLGLVSGLFLASRLVLKSKVETMVRDERARIAADLHDGLGGGLTQLILLSDATRRNLPGDSGAEAMLAQLSGQARELVRGFNEAVWLVNSQRDNMRDFASYLGKYAESFFQSTPIRCRFDIERNLPELPCGIGVRRNLFLAFKEALNNILRHSQAGEVRLSVRRDRGGVRIVVADNGVGFDPQRLDGSGNGLENLRRRAEDAGGTCEIHSRPGEGCTVCLSAPRMHKARRRRRNP